MLPGSHHLSSDKYQYDTSCLQEHDASKHARKQLLLPGTGSYQVAYVLPCTRVPGTWYPW